MRFQTIEAKAIKPDAINVRLVTAIDVSQHMTFERAEAERLRDALTIAIEAADAMTTPEPVVPLAPGGK